MTARSAAEKYGPVSIATVVGWIPLVAALWLFGKPWLVGEINVAMAAEIDNKIEKQVQPINGAFEVLVRRDIAALRKELADMRYRQRRGEDWTQKDAEDLVEIELELEAFQEALKKLSAK